MPSYHDTIELKTICARNAHLATTKEVAAELWNMAKEYQAKAAKLDGGKLPELGKPPRTLAG